jgi:hypothetical protein
MSTSLKTSRSVMTSTDADVLKTRIRSMGLISASANLPYHTKSAKTR